MKYKGKELIDWAVNKIQTDYPDDVSLLLGPKFCNLEIDGNEMAFNFFIPATERGYTLAKTFVIDGIGYDLFPMSWERVEGLANLNESITRCLSDGVILFARSEEDKQRFKNLQDKLSDNLKNPDFTYKKGLEKINIAMELYKNMLFEDSISKIRKASGFIMQDYLSEAIAAVNGTYFKKGPVNHIVALSDMNQIPEGFTTLYRGVVEAETSQEIKDLCYKMIDITRKFFINRAPKPETRKREYIFEDLAAWYEEGTYTFRRIYYYCDQKDVINSFSWGYIFQREFDVIQDQFGLEVMDAMSVFDSENLDTFRKRTEEIEQYIVSVLKTNGVKINEYHNLDEFLKVN